MLCWRGRRELIFFWLGVDIVALSLSLSRSPLCARDISPAAKSAGGLCSTCAAARIRAIPRERDHGMILCLFFHFRFQLR